jgi:phage tail-like protein
MPVPRKFALIRTNDQWLRVSHTNTALEGEVVQLYWLDDKPGGNADPGPLREPGGLAFDSNCRLYHSVTDEGLIERLLWGAIDPLRPMATQPAAVSLQEPADEETFGEFVAFKEEPIKSFRPSALAIDQDDRLFVADSGARRILIFDLWSNRLLRSVKLAARPIDLVARGRSVYVLLESPVGLTKLDAHGDPQLRDLPSGITAPSRIAAAPDGELYVLEHAGAVQARIVKLSDPQTVIEVKFTTDLEFQTGDPLLTSVCANENYVLVVARRPGEDFLRFCVGQDKPAELPPLKARNYDGRGIVRVPDGRIGFWTEQGVRHAVAARLVYMPSGQVTTYRLDSGEYQTVWGRIFLDACIPKETEIVIRCLTTDERVPQKAPIPSPPKNTSKQPEPDDDWPIPPPSLATQLGNAAAQLLHRRETGRELPWVRPAEDDVFQTYEAPVLAGPGRYLWIQIDLSGNTRATPRFKGLRAEYPTHDYLRRLPRTFSRDENVASFLRRYLATFEGMLGELEAKADTRATLLDPRSAPDEILPWLASFLGLTLDERMARAPRPGSQTVDVRRQLIREVIWLFRFRGTVAGLRRFIEIYLGTEIVLIERFRTRGLGGALLGDPSGLTSSSIVGVGLRVGGSVGTDVSEVVAGSIDDAFETNAHRFAIMIPAVLSPEQHDVVTQILELHRPAHTLVEVCTAAAGMRIGHGLQVAMTSIIGRGAGFTQLQIGGTALGRDAIVGRPQVGTMVGAGQTGEDSRIG